MTQARYHRAVQFKNLVVSRWTLRACDRRGSRTRVTEGTVIVRNGGSIELGADTRLMGRYAPVALESGPDGRLTIGSHVAINYGTSLSATSRVEIGDRVDIGPYCVIADADGTGEAAPIVIGDGAWLAARVVVRPGSTIGAGAVVTAGSVVEGDIPAGSLAAGSPARVIRTLGASDAPAATTSSATAADPRPPAVTGRRWTPPRSPSAGPERSGLLVSDFTIDPLQRALADVGWHAEVAPYGSVVPTLLSPPSSGTDFAAVWTSADGMLPSVASAMAGGEVSAADVEADVDGVVGLLTGLSGFRVVLVPTWTVPWFRRGRGAGDLRVGGVAWAVAVANHRLMERTADAPNVVVLDAQRWVAAAGDPSSDARRWYLGKVPFDDAVFDIAADDMVAAGAAAAGATRKLIVLDLDNTLWGGTVGDDGYAALRLGGHDATGEAFVDFQRSLQALRRRGVLLALASKNEEAVALEAIDRHPEMVLRRDDFVAWRIDWNDKAANVADMVAQLNLGLQSTVFIDDNPYERGRVSEALPEVLVPDWPVDPADYVTALESLRCFDILSVSEEDRQRTELYAAERERASLQTGVTSIDDWIAQLELTVAIEELSEVSLARSTQLLNKTNQMNLTSRRCSETELRDWAARDGNELWTVSVSDRFGNAGLTGLIGIESGGGVTRLVDFVLSCRVFSRGVEQVMLSFAAERARSAGSTSLIAEFVPTKKNQPCRRFLDESALQRDGDRYDADLAAGAIFSRPEAVTVVVGSRAEAPS